MKVGFKGLNGTQIIISIISLIIRIRPDFFCFKVSTLYGLSNPKDRFSLFYRMIKVESCIKNGKKIQENLRIEVLVS